MITRVSGRNSMISRQASTPSFLGIITSITTCRGVSDPMVQAEVWQGEEVHSVLRHDLRGAGCRLLVVLAFRDP